MRSGEEEKGWKALVLIKVVPNGASMAARWLLPAGKSRTQHLSCCSERRADVHRHEGHTRKMHLLNSWSRTNMNNSRNNLSKNWPSPSFWPPWTTDWGFGQKLHRHHTRLHSPLRDVIVKEKKKFSIRAAPSDHLHPLIYLHHLLHVHWCPQSSCRPPAWSSVAEDLK